MFFWSVDAFEIFSPAFPNSDLFHRSSDLKKIGGGEWRGAPEKYFLKMK
jgi:hypothetical protein